jgi:hypothetical protein
VVYRHGGCHLDCWVEDDPTPAGERLISHESIIKPSQSCIPLSCMHERQGVCGRRRRGSEACRIFVRRLLRRAPGGWAARSLHLSPHIHVRGGIVKTTRYCRRVTLDGACVMCDRWCHPALCNTCLTRLCARSARSTPRGRTSVPDNIGQSQSRQDSLSPDTHRQQKQASACVHFCCSDLCAQLHPPAHFWLRASGDRLCLNAAWRREHR